MSFSRSFLFRREKPQPAILVNLHVSYRRVPEILNIKDHFFWYPITVTTNFASTTQVMFIPDEGVSTFPKLKRFVLNLAAKEKDEAAAEPKYEYNEDWEKERAPDPAEALGWGCKEIGLDRMWVEWSCGSDGVEDTSIFTGIDGNGDDEKCRMILQCMAQRGFRDILHVNFEPKEDEADSMELSRGESQEKSQESTEASENMALR